MNKKLKIILSITGILIVLVGLLGFTFAYIGLYIVGNTKTKSVSFTTDNLYIKYGDNTDTIISKTDIIPGDLMSSKEFTVTGGESDGEYVVVIDNVNISSLNRPQDVVYTLTCTSSISGNTCNGVRYQTQFPKKETFIVGNKIKAGETQSYKLQLYYREAKVRQTEDMGKTVSARVTIKTLDSVVTPYSNTSTLSLSYNILQNAKKVKNGTSFVADTLTKPAQEVSTSSEKELAITQDDLGTSLYFRGNVTDNYVTFKSKCWRIVRIEGDGSIKIAQESSSTCSTSMSVNYYNYMNSANYGYYSGVIYNSDGSSSSTRYTMDYFGVESTTVNGTPMRSSLNTWYTSYLNSTTGLKNDTWCLGNITDLYSSSSPYSQLDAARDDLIYSNTTFYYEAGKRLYGYGEAAYATHKCYENNDESYESYFGTLTADEVAYAGGKVNTNNANYYLYNSSYSQRTLTPAYYSSSYDYTFYIPAGNATISPLTVSQSYRPRAVVTLLNTTNIVAGGEGTLANPYVVN